MEKSKAKSTKIAPAASKLPPLNFKKMTPPKFFAPKTFRITQHKGGK